MGGLATIGLQAPANLTVVVLDNGLYEETGGQASHTGRGVDLALVAKGCGIADARTVTDMAGVEALRARIHDALGGPTLAVVSTTMVITSLKTFDIVYTLTNGNYDTEVIANLMLKQMFTFGDFGRASAVAVVLLLAIVPVMAFNIRQFRVQESVR